MCRGYLRAGFCRRPVTKTDWCANKGLCLPINGQRRILFMQRPAMNVGASSDKENWAVGKENRPAD
jgi:hypothetical protein